MTINTVPNFQHSRIGETWGTIPIGTHALLYLQIERDYNARR
jgi:hypothetical protein